MTGGTIAPSVLPQLTQPPQPGHEFQALAPGGMTGLRAAGGPATGVAPMPASGGAPSTAAPQPVAPAQGQTTPIIPQPPLPKGFNDPQQAIQELDRRIARLAATGNPNLKGTIASLEDWRDRIAKASEPMSVGPSTTIVDPRTRETLFQGAYASGQGTMSRSAMDAAAETYFQIGKLPPNLGRGMQGSANINSIIVRATELHPNEPTESWPQRWQNFFTDGAGKRILSTRAATLTLAETEAKSLIPRIRDASAKVNRTQYPSLNKIIEMAQEGTGDPNIVRLGIASESLAQTYARVLSPTGAPTVADKENAHKILNQAWSQGQIEAALDQMEKEIASAKSALGEACDEIGGRGKGDATPPLLRRTGRQKCRRKPSMTRCPAARNISLPTDL